MAIDKHLFDFIIELHNQKQFEKCKSVLDMGDQDISVIYSYAKQKLINSNIKFEDEFLEKYLTQEKPRLQSSYLWKMLGFEKTHRLDIFYSERKKDDKENFIHHNLNNQISASADKYDLVTDFGNNEHPFNVAQTYKNMHQLTNKNGLMLISQQYIFGNGFYNFDPSFFENIAATNEYKIIYSFMTIYNNVMNLNTPIEPKILKIFNFSTIDSITLNYFFKKETDKDFIFPNQGFGKELKKNNIYLPIIERNEFNYSRSYLPTNVEELGLKILLKTIIKKIKKKLKLKIF